MLVSRFHSKLNR